MRRVTLALLALGLLLSCGPTKSTSALVQAHMAIRRAEGADGDKKHPYELTLAREYYVKSKEEAGYSQFELSEQLAKQAIEYAKIASGEAASTPTPAPEEESTDSTTP
jgi:hypothetical protein